MNKIIHALLYSLVLFASPLVLAQGEPVTLDADTPTTTVLGNRVYRACRLESVGPRPGNVRRGARRWFTHRVG